MSDLFEARVEAAAEVLLRDYQSEYDGGEVSEFLDVARAVLEAADAVVTVEQIAEVLRPLIREHQGADDNDAWWVADHAHDYAQAVLALFGKVAGDE